MSIIEQIENELLEIDTRISAYTIRIERERGEITNTMNKAQSVFGDQRPGQDFVMSLYRTLQNLINADNSLEIVRNEIKQYSQQIRK